MAWPNWGSEPKTSQKIAGAGSDDASSGTVVWATPGAITANDDTDANASLSGPAQSHWLVGDTFAFSLGSIVVSIDGLTVDAELWATNPIAMTVNQVRMRKAGVFAGTLKSPATGISASRVVYTWGDATDLWGAAWSQADVEHGGFGAGFTVNEAGAGSAVASCDVLRITVHYSDYLADPWHGALLYGLGALAALPILGALAGAARQSLLQRLPRSRHAQTRTLERPPFALRSGRRPASRRAEGPNRITPADARRPIERLSHAAA